MKRTGQTFALVHLIELVLAVVVVAIVGVGIMGMIQQTQFFQQFYARDTAYIIETMQGTPNGNIQFGYLWASPDYTLDIKPDRVTVSKISKTFLFIQGKPVTKAFGTGKTTIEETTFSPQYFTFGYTDGRITGSETGTPAITVRPLSAAVQCPPQPGFAGIEAVPNSASDPIGKETTESIVSAIQNSGAGTTGLKLFVTYEYAPDPEIIVLAASDTALAKHAVCHIKGQSAPSGIQISESSRTVESPRLQTVVADVIIIARGQPTELSTVKEAITQGLLAAKSGAS